MPDSDPLSGTAVGEDTTVPPPGFTEAAPEETCALPERFGPFEVERELAGDRLAVRARDVGQVALYETGSWKRIPPAVVASPANAGRPDRVDFLSWSPDGATFATGSLFQTLRFHEGRSGRPLGWLVAEGVSPPGEKERAAGLRAFAWSPDGAPAMATLPSHDLPGRPRLFLWDVKAGAPTPGCSRPGAGRPAGSRGGTSRARWAWGRRSCGAGPRAGRG